MLAPDGFKVIELAGAEGMSTAVFSLPAGAIGRAIKHRTVTEIWYVLAGQGHIWRRTEAAQSVVPLRPGLSVYLPPDTCFQVRADAASPLEVLGATAPAWPGETEVRLVAGQWPLTPLWQTPQCALREAGPADAEALFAIAMDAKAYWGYTEQFLAQCADELRPKFAPGEYWCALADNERLYGFAGISAVNDAGVIELEALFVDPRCIGTGLGVKLLEAACREGRARGAASLSIVAEPQAAGFYRRYGARCVGEYPSGSIPGRMLPLFVMKL